MSKFINLTPHTINVRGENGEELVAVPPSGEVARVATSRTLGGTVHGVPFFKVQFGEVFGLPEIDPNFGSNDGVVRPVFIVSALVVSALTATGAKRPDVFSPGELVRNEDGQPIGCLGLVAQA